MLVLFIEENLCFALIYNTIECGVTTTRTIAKTRSANTNSTSERGQANRGGRGGSAPKVGKGVAHGRN